MKLEVENFDLKLGMKFASDFSEEIFKEVFGGRILWKQ